MKNKFKHTIHKAKDTTLTQEEKASMKASLEEYMLKNPLVETSGNFTLPRRVSSLEWMGTYFNNQKFTASFAGVFILLVFLGGTSFASKYALPGDPLYGIKILNEKLASSFALTPEAEVQVETLHAVNRLEEAEELSVQGRLDENKRTAIQNSFSKSGEDAVKSLVVLQDKDKESGMKMSLSFKDKLSEYKNRFENRDQKKTSAFSRSEETGLPQAVGAVIDSLEDSVPSVQNKDGLEKNDNGDVKKENQNIFITATQSIKNNQSQSTSTASTTGSGLELGVKSNSSVETSGVNIPTLNINNQTNSSSGSRKLPRVRLH